MAIDTALKRGSSVQAGMFGRATLPFPDGTISAADRAFTSYTYAGIAIAAPTTVAAAVETGFIVNLGRLMNR